MNRLKTLCSSRGLHTLSHFLLCLPLKHFWSAQCFCQSYQIELRNWERERPGGKNKSVLEGTSSYNLTLKTLLLEYFHSVVLKFFSLL